MWVQVCESGVLDALFFPFKTTASLIHRCLSSSNSTSPVISLPLEPPNLPVIVIIVDCRKQSPERSEPHPTPLNPSVRLRFYAATTRMRKRSATPISQSEVCKAKKRLAPANLGKRAGNSIPAHLRVGLVLVLCSAVVAHIHGMLTFRMIELR